MISTGQFACTKLVTGNIVDSVQAKTIRPHAGHAHRIRSASGALRASAHAEHSPALKAYVPIRSEL